MKVSTLKVAKNVRFAINGLNFGRITVFSRECNQNRRKIAILIILPFQLSICTSFMPKNVKESSFAVNLSIFASFVSASFSLILSLSFSLSLLPFPTFCSLPFPFIPLCVSSLLPSHLSHISLPLHFLSPRLRHFS